MALLGRGLAKLTLSASKDRDGHQKLGTFVAMYNPESIHFAYESRYELSTTLNKHEQSSEYDMVRPPSLDLELVLDGRAPGARHTVDEQLGQLRALCFAIGDKGEPPYLRVSWGKMNWHGQGYFSGRCQRMGVTYTLFDRNGQPLRASAQLSLVADSTDDLKAMQKGGGARKQALTTSVARDSLPLVAGLVGVGAVSSAADYLKLGYANNLDNLRNLAPGDSLSVG